MEAEAIRLNLLLASLYISSFELLKSSIIDIPKNFFVPDPDTDNQAWLERQTDHYRDEIGVDYSGPDGYKLIPSCRWFQNMGAIENAEVEEIRRIRDHRNELAHELHIILFSGNLAIDVYQFVRITELLRQIELFWFRHGEPQFDLETGDIIDADQIHDEEFVSGKEAVLQLITSAALEYLEQFESKTAT